MAILCRQDIHALQINDRIEQLSFEQRATYAKAISQAINRNPDTPMTNIESLRSKGYLNLGRLFDDKQVDKIKDSLFNIKTIFNAHIPIEIKRCKNPDNARLTITKENDIQNLPHGLYSWTGDNILRCPHVAELITNPAICSLAERYLGCIPTFYDVNCIMTVSKNLPKTENTIRPHEVQTPHRDCEDFKSLTMLVYLTDVDSLQDGPHCYVEGTHNSSSAYIETDPVYTTYGKKGFGIIEDTYGWHYGTPLGKEGYRMILWLRYGLYDNEMYSDTNQLWRYKINKSEFEKYIEMNEYNNYLLRLFIK